MKTRIHISHTQLPKAALKKMSATQRSFIDEFTFYKTGPSTIEGWYAGQLLAVWKNGGWYEPNWLLGSVKRDPSTLPAPKKHHRGIPLYNRTGKSNDWFIVHEGRVRWGTLAQAKKDADNIVDFGNLPPRAKGSWA